jgi:SMC interacting uncharacterized protein involved in chromosome segregation
MDLGHFDVTLDVLVLVLAAICATLVWRIYRMIGAVRDVIATLVRDIERSNGRLEEARDKIDSLNEEIQRQALTGIERRLKALEDRAADTK